MATASPGSRRFDVALSFPGDYREFVKQVADQLASHIARERVLFDGYHEAELARPDLDLYLPALYREQSELVVLFLGPEYAAKRWCRLEWRSIRQLISTVDASRIMFLCYGREVDLTELGIFDGDGRIDFAGRAAKEIADKIHERLVINARITQPRSASTPAEAGRVLADITRIIRFAPATLIGRAAETKLLDEAWQQAIRGEARRPHVMTFVALGGEGKTSLVAKWAADLAHRDWPGCEAAYAWSFYSQGAREQVQSSSDLFLKDALTAFGDPALANSPQTAFEKGRRLAQLVGQRRALLILDGLEPLQYAPTSPTAGELKDHGVAALLKGLAANNRGLCVVTTRYSIPDLRAYWGTTAAEVKVLRLEKSAGVALLRSLEVRGTQPEFEELVEDVKGHALTLNLLGAWLRDAHAGDIRKRDLVKLEEADAEEQGGHAFRMMDAYARWFESEGEKGKRAVAMLRLLGLFDRPATADCVGALLQMPAIVGLTEALVGMSEAQRNVVFSRLETAKLVTVHRDGAGGLLSLDAHPLLREYFALRVGKEQPDAWRAGHRRLYEYLCASTTEGDQPSLDDLQPLYQAVAHGCHAGLQQEVCDKVYFDRIARRRKAHTVHKLGAFGSDLGAVACFFEVPWSRVSPALAEADRGWLLNQAAFRLRALGRLTEALEPMRSGLEMAVKLADWENAATGSDNLSVVELTLGDVAGALRDADQSVNYADRIRDSLVKMVGRATHADALHQAGRWEEAEARFREAEEMLAGNHPRYPLLYSTAGFAYCERLLAAPEREAWQLTLRSSSKPQSSLSDSCGSVSQRAAKMLKGRAPSDSLIHIALDHLTRGRTALYEAILKGNSLDPCREPLQHAVNDLRRAGYQEYLLRGLLTRAWLRTLTGARAGPDSAQTDLDEAWQIAERGPMPLFQADIHLHRARLFHAVTPYPWSSPKADLAAARHLIVKHGYLRRMPELEDAEAELKPT